MPGRDCEKCKGSGLVPREASEADKDIHPILSRQGMVCPTCGGSGRMPSAEQRRRNTEAAAKEES
jgi:DnaJ-class molecular chaperone